MKQTIPSYWDEHLKEKIDLIHRRQIAAGKSGASVALITDMHWCENEKHSGAIMEKVLFDCGIPYFFNAGDLVSGKGICSPQELFGEILEYREQFAAIEHKCLMVEGNHDSAHSTFEPPAYYVENMTEETFHEYYFRPYTQYKDRVFSDEISYYYADDTAHKIRYIVLNSQNVPNDEKTEEGYAKYNRMRHFGFLQKQVNWFANVALAVPDNTWSVVVCSHATYFGAKNEENVYNYDLMMKVINAFQKHTSYAGKSEHENPLFNAEVAVDFTGKGGNFVAWLGGHRHKDHINVLDGITFVDVTTDASYENYMKLGKRGKIDEHAFDVFTIDTKAHKVSITRIGGGEDREFEYEVF
jgi:hypothetical protein